jgi:hypothetical protein
VSNGPVFGIIFAILTAIWAVIIISVILGIHTIDLEPISSGVMSPIGVIFVVTIAIIGLFFIDLSLELDYNKRGVPK